MLIPWRPVLTGPIDPKLRQWIQDSRSTTKKLKQLGLNLKVAQVEQRMCYGQWQSHTAERFAYLYERQVVLKVNQKAWVLAITRMPFKHCTGPRQKLLTLARKPLGSLLHQDAKLERGTFEYARLDARHALFKQASELLDQPVSYLFARRSTFIWYGKSLELTEVFLPHSCYNIPL